MSKKNHQKIKAELFKLSTLSKLIPRSTINEEKKYVKRISSGIKNDELGYFSSLDNL